MSGAWVVAPPLAYTNPDLLNKRLLLLFKLRLFLTERPSPFFLILAKEKNIAKDTTYQGIKYFDSFNTFSSKQKLQQALKS